MAKKYEYNKKICERQKKNNTGKYLCEYCNNRFKYRKTLRAHQKNRCGKITKKQFEKKKYIRNKKLNDKKNEIRSNIKSMIDNDILTKNELNKKDSKYLYIETYKFSLLMSHDSGNKIVLYGSQGNKLFILKYYKDEVEYESEKDNWNALSDKKISFSYLPSVPYLQKKILIKTYEGPTLSEIFLFCNISNLKIADEITLCNIAIDILTIFKFLKKEKIKCRRLTLDDFTWNYVKNKIVLINFGKDTKSNYSFANNIIIDFFFPALIQAYDKDFSNTGIHYHQAFKYSKIDTADCAFFQDFDLKKLFSQSLHNDRIDTIYSFFYKEIKKYTNNKYRFTWENYFQNAYKIKINTKNN